MFACSRFRTKAPEASDSNNHKRRKTSRAAHAHRKYSPAGKAHNNLNSPHARAVAAIKAGGATAVLFLLEAMMQSIISLPIFNFCWRHIERARTVRRHENGGGAPLSSSTRASLPPSSISSLWLFLREGSRRHASWPTICLLVIIEEKRGRCFINALYTLYYHVNATFEHLKSCCLT